MRIGILGYGNLGKALVKKMKKTPHELVAVFSRRKITDGELKTLDREKIPEYRDKLDILLIATASFTDAESDVKEYLPYFNTIDSFDMHKRMKGYISELHKIAAQSKHAAIVGAGWDPGLLSIVRVLAKISVESENINTFWGVGKSLGHTSALKKINGVKYAVQYTVPKTESKTFAKNTDAKLNDFDRHRRECYIVPAVGADLEMIKREVETTEGYFAGYDTLIHFIDEPEFLINHAASMHQGEVIATHIENGEKTFFDMKIEIPSNPDFTANIMISYINAINYLQKRAVFGAFTPLDIPMSSLISNEDLFNII